MSASLSYCSSLYAFQSVTLIRDGSYPFSFSRGAYESLSRTPARQRSRGRSNPYTFPLQAPSVCALRPGSCRAENSTSARLPVLPASADSRRTPPRPYGSHILQNAVPFNSCRIPSGLRKPPFDPRSRLSSLKTVRTGRSPHSPDSPLLLCPEGIGYFLSQHLIAAADAEYKAARRSVP